MSTVSGTECVVYIAVSVRSQFLGKFFLAFFYSFLCSSFLFVSCVFCQTSWFAFFFSIETKVFEQQHFARLQSSSFHGSFFTHTVVSKLNFNTQQFRQVFDDMFQRKFIGNAFRTTQMRANNDASAVCKDLLQSGKSRTHTGVVCDVEVFVQGYIEVHANKCLFSGKIEFVNCLHNTLFLFKSVFNILFFDRPQSYYLFRFLAIKSLFILGFWFLFCNFIGVTEIFAYHLQTTGSTFGSTCLTNITTVKD